jgi:tRNA modification GTPase
MLRDNKSTITAIATAVVPQQGSISIVRVSGDKALQIARQIFSTPGKQSWNSHSILYGYIHHPETKEIIDEALLLIMKAPRSYTKEDIVEFHCHGGIIPVQRVLQLTVTLGARIAGPGEFTLRAFLNGRLDLTQAESVAELVSAGSTEASQIALAGLQGKLGKPIQHLRASCLDVLAEIEARIDFEEDLPPLDIEGIKDELDSISHKIKEIISTADKGQLLRNGLKVAIVGRPNVGKSSLLNAWSRCDRAIVTDLPGTTRDVIESQLVVQGIPIQVLDTAGIRETKDTVEQIGVERSLQAVATADLILLTIDKSMGWTPGDEDIYTRVKHRPLILVMNKSDLNPSNKIVYPSGITNSINTAATHNQGIEDLENAIVKLAQENQITAANLEFALNQRQAEALSRAQIALNQVQDTIDDELPLDFWTIDLRTAVQALGEITGEDVTESVLDRIFSRFCIGK